MSAEDIELAMNATLAGEEPDEPDQDEVEQHDDEPADEPEAVEDQPMILGKFRDQAALEKAYSELERKLGGRQPEPEPEPEVEDEGYDEALYAPTIPMPVGGPPQSIEQYEQWVIESPRDALGYAGQTGNQKLVDHLWSVLKQVDPGEYADFKSDIRDWVRAQELEQIKAELRAEREAEMQQYQPIRANHEQQVNAMMAQMVTQAIPEWDQVKEQVRPLLEQHPIFAPAFANAATPQARVEVVQMAYNQFAWNRYQAQQRQAPTPANNPAPPRAATRTRQSAAEVDADESESAQIVRMGNEARGMGGR